MTTNKDSGHTVNIKGSVTAGRDVIQGNQYNYGSRDERTMQITNADEYRHTLADLEAKFAALKQTDLNSAQKRNVEVIELQVAQAAEEAKTENPDGNAIKATLTEAKETFDLISGSIASAAGLGAVLGNLIFMAVKIFGG